MRKIAKFNFTDFILWGSLLLVGGFHEYISCALAAAMCIYLLVRIGKGEKLRLKKGLFSIAVCVICVAYGATCLWAVDSGMALVGFLKFLPLILYLFCLWQEERAGQALVWLPYLGAAMALVSAIGMQFQATRSFFSVADRLAGFFQYPNTFAIFLLTCELLLLKREKKTILDVLTILILVAGILYTGSRTAFVVSLAANAAMIFLQVNKKTKWILAGGALAMILAAVLLAQNENSIFHRYLSISLTESTFVGRILYFVDALPLLLKYPFGMGFMGYYYVQNSIQTGVYDVVYIHNDFLQLILDVGLIPGGLLIAAIIRWLLQKEIPAADKIIVGALCLHSLFDFNLQFVGMFILLLTLMHQERDGEYRKIKHTIPLKAGAIAVIVVALYLGTALTLSHLEQHVLSDKLYPYNTQNKLTMLEQASDLTEANDLADEILKQNTAFFAPYSIKAKCAYAKGNFTEVIQYKRLVFEKRPFDYNEYDEYCKMLINGIVLYEQAGDLNSAQFCQNELVRVPQLLEKNRNRLSKLGSMIDDQPITELAPEIQEYMDALGG